MHTSSSSDDHRLSRQACYDYIKTNIFTPSHRSEQKIGLEMECFPIEDYTLEKPQILDLKVTKAILHQLASEQNWKIEEGYDDHGHFDFKSITIQGLGNITFEPGGQLELALDPMSSLLEAKTAAKKIVSLLKLSFASHDFVFIGRYPWQSSRDIGLQMAKPRYKAMNDYFASINSFGQQMMRTTATIQVCMDFDLDPEKRVQDYLVSQFINEVATAIFANSWNEVDGTDYESYRAQIWRKADPSRTGWVGISELIKNPTFDTMCKSYFDFAMQAPVIFLPVLESEHTILEYERPVHKLSFDQFLTQGYQGIYPQHSDFLTHLSLLFPEVRPRGFLEFRGIDAQARPFKFAPAAFLIGLMYHSENKNKIFKMLCDDPTIFDRIHHRAPFGMSNPDLQKIATDLMEMSLETMDDLPMIDERSRKNLEIYADKLTFQQLTPARDLKNSLRAKHKSFQDFSLKDYQEVVDRWVMWTN